MRKKKNPREIVRCEEAGPLDLQELGQIIQFHRKKSKLTQAQLANLAGIGKTAVFDIENALKSPRFETMMAILSVLNIKFSLSSPLIAIYWDQRHAQS